MQEVCVDVAEVLSVLKLPDGLRLKDWSEPTPDGFWISSQSLKPQVLSSEYQAAQYFDTMIVGIERISDGKVAKFEICGLNHEGKMQPKIVPLFQLAHALDRAIAILLEH
jgi:hypothetical protein